MDVSVIKVDTTTKFANIGNGKTFFYDGNYYMRVAGKDTGYNVVALTTGNLYKFGSNSDVIPENLMVVRKGE